MTETLGKLTLQPALDRPDLLAGPVVDALKALGGSDYAVAEIDPELADTANFCAAYDIGPEISANCVVVAGKRGGEMRYAACLVLATTRADINGVVRKFLNVRKASFAPMDTAVSLTDMEYGGITPVGLPAEWPVLVDQRVADSDRIVIGSGVRRSKLVVPGATVAALPAAQVLPDLATN